MPLERLSFTFAHRTINLRLATITKGSKSDNLRDCHAHHSGDPDTLALSALGWVLSDSQRAERLLALTGLTADVLRDQLTDRATLSAVLGFLEAHEPDLLLAADALNVAPGDLVKARAELSR